MTETVIVIGFALFWLVGTVAIAVTVYRAGTGNARKAKLFTRKGNKQW